MFGTLRHVFFSVIVEALVRRDDVEDLLVGSRTSEFSVDSISAYRRAAELHGSFCNCIVLWHVV
jgi:hypothetical protein